MTTEQHRNDLIDKLEHIDRQLSQAEPGSFTHYDLSSHAELLATEIDRLRVLLLSGKVKVAPLTAQFPAGMIHS